MTSKHFTIDRLSNLQIILPDRDKTNEGCPECSGIKKEEGCLYELCEHHFQNFQQKEIDL